MIPNNQEAESMVLHALLNESEEVFDEISNLTSEHFFSRSHRIIFEACLEMFKKKVKLDLLTLTDFLKTSGKLEEIGGPSFIAKIGSFFPTTAHYEQYVEILKEKYRLRKLLSLSEMVQNRSIAEDDSKNLIYEFESELFKLSSESVSDQNEMIKANETVIKRIKDRREGKKVFGIPSGVASFDRISGGYRSSLYYTFAAQPGYGKTAWAEQSALSASMKGSPVLFISLEMTSDRLMERMISHYSGISLWKYLSNNLRPEELDAWDYSRNKIMQLPLHLICPIELTGIELRSIIRKFKKKHGIEIFVLDYLQKMKSKNQKEERHVIREASSCALEAIQESKVAGIIISQMNREFNKCSRPNMSHLAESNQIERDSDFIGFIWPEIPRHELQKGQMQPVILTIEKNRDGICGCDERLNFDAPILTFKERI